MKTENDNELIATIRNWAAELGFQDIGFTGVDLGAHEGYLQKWLDAGYEGTMDWMARHGTKRSRPGNWFPAPAPSYRAEWIISQKQKIPGK